ncbi:MAG: hypothetical protein WCN87_00845 [Chlamydiota bacterium]
MWQKLATFFVILGCLLSQLLIPWMGKIPCQTITGSIAILWLLWGTPASFIGALSGGFLLDILSFDTPFGLFIFSYVAATFIATRLSRFAFQNAFVTYLLFVSMIAFISPLIELFIIMVRYQINALKLPLLIENVLIPTFLDITVAAFWGLIALAFLAKKRLLKIV